MCLRGVVDVVAGRRRRWTLLRSRRWGLAGRLGRGGDVPFPKMTAREMMERARSGRGTI